MRRTLTSVVVVDAGVSAVAGALYFALHATGPAVAVVTALLLTWGLRVNSPGSAALSFVVFESLVVMWQLSQASAACWVFARVCLALGFPGAVASLVLNVLIGLPFLFGIMILGAPGRTRVKWKADVHVPNVKGYSHP